METKHIQGKVVAVCGKGGVGKTAADGFSYLAMWCDHKIS